MSTFKKAEKARRRIHKERSQPEHRAHLGLLEKKKDYKLRAEERHERKDLFKLLHKKALNRNPDEFNFHMLNSKTENGDHIELEQPDEDTSDQIKLMQTQDIRYITTRRTIEKNKIERLQSHLHMIDMANEVKNKHIFFVDSEDEAKRFDVAEKLETHPSLLGRRTNRIRIGDLEKMKLDQLTSKQLEKLNEDRAKLYKELEKRIDREKQLTVVQEKMELKRRLQEKRLLKPQRISPGTKDSAPVYKFKYERKK